MAKRGINIGQVRIYVTPYQISRIIFTLDLVLSYTDLFVFGLVQIVLHWSLICYNFAINDNLLFLLMMIAKRMRFKHLTQLVVI